jgi:hydroxymethylpyrimidine/phosphomethylpyrimidine kinase
LSIAGFDPSGGAGVVADCKTFEAHHHFGISVVTSLTYQNENQFKGMKWLKYKEIIRQISSLFDEYKIEYVKIGLIEDEKTLTKVIKYLKYRNQNITILWDPILASSSGYIFHKKLKKKKIKKILKKIDIVTPNFKEIRSLYKSKDALKSAEKLSNYCIVYLKGGHNEEDIGKDYIYKDESFQELLPKKVLAEQKHGSGCVFSSALLSNYASTKNIFISGMRSKKYIEKYLSSHPSLLGVHI